MIDLTPEQEPVADLIEDKLVPFAAELVVAVRELGPDRIGRLLDKVTTLEEARVAMVVFAAMVSPDATMRQVLGWTDTMRQPMRGRPQNGARGEPAAERERQRLVAASVPPETALLLSARMVEQEQAGAEGLTVRDRMLKAIEGGRKSA